jgi:mRNA-degrading endonuclease toxin of MazEF toxin-antitoxin module
MPMRIRRSSTRYRIGADEAGRHLDRCRRQGLRREATPRLFRLPVEPNERNGLRAACRLMVDKITTVPKTKVAARVGRLDDEDILRLNQAVLVFLGLAVSPKTKQVA